ncbi:hypothetical protein cym2001_47690 [Pseudomonas sp. CYM-20-01]|nr:hypothetical protein cym2001_47690 [Pseudomonas sp. CYM-20-01]
MGREAGGAWVTHVAAVYEQHSVSAGLWVGRFCLCGGKITRNLRAIFTHQKKGHPYGWPKGKSGALKAVQQMGPIIRSLRRAVKSTLTMLLIVKARIAMKRRAVHRAFYAPGRCEQITWLIQLTDF